MAEEVKSAFGVETEFLKGFTGSFDVIVNGDTIFSKLKEGRFPDPGEIEALIRDKFSLYQTISPSGSS